MLIASIILTVALVVITAFYAWQTRQTVVELRKARSANLVPKLGISFDHPGGAIGFPVLSSVGMGPAIDAKVTIAYEPAGPQTSWSNPLLPVGARHRFMGPHDIVSMEELTAKYERVVLRGTCKDALGDSHDIHETVDVREYWELGKAARHLIETDYPKKMADELERIRKALERRPR